MFLTFTIIVNCNFTNQFLLFHAQDPSDLLQLQDDSHSVLNLFCCLTHAGDEL